jgi:NAD(P)-dependent dehydrogenase (short-subunit alcohol dehydrogenase family)
MCLEGKVTIVTGGGTGIGRATAHLFANEGSSVVVAGRRADLLVSVVEEIESFGGKAIPVQCDVSRSSEVEALIDAAVKTFGGIDNVINNAGLDVSKPLLETTEEEWDLVLSVNLKGHFLCAKAAVPQMLTRGGGCIVNTSSVLALASMGGVASYSASKAAIIALTRSMALEWTRLGIRVNCIAPGSTETAMMWGALSDEFIPSRRRAEQETLPIGRLADPEEISRVSLWLCSAGASFLAGSTIVIDGGALSEYPAPRWSAENSEDR